MNAAIGKLRRDTCLFRVIAPAHPGIVEISRIGVDRILRRIENNDTDGQPVTQLIEPQLVVRATA